MQMDIERTKIFIRVEYLSPYKAGAIKIPGELIKTTVPFRGYFRKLFKEHKKKFVLLEVSVPEKLKEEDRKDFAANVAEVVGFASLPYTVNYYEKGDCHSLYFFFCEYIYYPEGKQETMKVVYIDERGHYCSPNKKGAKRLEIKHKTNLSKKHEVFKPIRSAFIAQMKQIKEKLGEIIEEYNCTYEKGIFTNKLRYKELGRFQMRKAGALNDVLEECDIWLNDLNFFTETFADFLKKQSMFTLLLEKINNITKTHRWKISENHTVNIFSSYETKDSFLHRCGVLVGSLRSSLFALS